MVLLVTVDTLHSRALTPALATHHQLNIFPLGSSRPSRSPKIDLGRPKIILHQGSLPDGPQTILTHHPLFQQTRSPSFDPLFCYPLRLLISKYELDLGHSPLKLSQAWVRYPSFLCFLSPCSLSHKRERDFIEWELLSLTRYLPKFFSLPPV